MKVDARKIIQSTVNTELDVQEVTLLSGYEWRECKNIIPVLDTSWWLRTSLNIHNVGILYPTGYCEIDYAFNLHLGVRPALRISNLTDCNLNKRERVELFGYDWTIVSEDLALCDNVVDTSPFRSDYKEPDACDYNFSDVKKFVEKWFERKLKE